MKFADEILPEEVGEALGWLLAIGALWSDGTRHFITPFGIRLTEILKGEAMSTRLGTVKGARGEEVTVTEFAIGTKYGGGLGYQLDGPHGYVILTESAVRLIAMLCRPAEPQSSTLKMPGKEEG